MPVFDHEQKLVSTSPAAVAAPALGPINSSKGMKPVSSGTASQVQCWPPCCTALCFHLPHSKLFMRAPCDTCTAMAFLVCLYVCLPGYVNLHIQLGFCLPCYVLSVCLLPICMFYVCLCLPTCSACFPAPRCVRQCVYFPYLHVCLSTCISVCSVGLFSFLPTFHSSYPFSCLPICLFDLLSVNQSMALVAPP